MEDAAGLWDELVERIDGLAAIVLDGAPADDLHRSEGLRHALRHLAAGIDACVEYDDVLHPELGVLIENRRSWGLDNPDTKYSFTRLEPGATYRVEGDPGSATELEVQVASGHFADGRFSEWSALRRWRRGDGTLPLDDRGSVSIEFTAPPGTDHLHVREYFGDWGAEVPALLTVSRSGAPLPPPPTDPDAMRSRFELLGLWLTEGARCWAELGTATASGEPGDVTPFLPPATATGLGGQAYGMGAYRCAPDEAVVLELRPPPCRYWSVSLATWFWESTDAANRQCSLNHTQARPGPDGAYRFVVCHDDPGLANWLDPAGYERGTVALRLLDAEGELPVLGYRTVAREALADAVGAGEPMCDPPARRATLRHRRDGLVGRYRR